MGWSCRFVPWLALCASLSGCLRSHTVYDGPRCRAPAGMVCCNEADLAETDWESLCPFECPIHRRLVPASECGPSVGLPDAGVPPMRRDAGTPPRPDGGEPPLSCEPVRAIAGCSPAPGLVAVRDIPFEVPYRMDACACCPATECQVTGIDPDARVLSLTTTLCDDLCDCDECNPVVGACAVPGLPVAGNWAVHVNGAPGVILPVRDAPGGPANPSGCGTFAEDDGCGSSDVLSGDEWDPTSVCLRERQGRTVVELRHDCWRCLYQGPCLSYLVPDARGGEIHVGASAYPGACDGVCDDGCFSTVRDCEIPDLPPGDGVYRIIVNGTRRATLGRGASAMRTTYCD